MICIHHNKDLDGFASGAIVKRKFPDCRLIGWDYKDPIPWDKITSGQDVIMIDISFPMNEMFKLRKLSTSLTWIDHHVSAKKDWDSCTAGLQFSDHGIKYIYENGRAACEIGWEYLNPGFSPPYSIVSLGRYDTWRKAEDWERHVLPFQYGMREICTSVDTFPEEAFMTFNKPFIDSVIEKGKAILHYQEGQDKLACERYSFERRLQGLRAICLNYPAFSSNTLKSVYDPNKHDIMVGINYTGDKWTVSLRSDKPNVDASVIATLRGGGGHKGAAGFEAKTLEDIFDKT